MKRIILSISFTFLLGLYIQARAQDPQDAPIHIAIIPFTSSAYGNSIAEQVENEVASCFANKDRFFLIDRGVTEKIKEELDAAKDNSSVYAKVVAEQGHLAGAEYIITGVVDPMQIGTTPTTNYLTKAISNEYHGTIRLSLQIDKVETGRVFYSQPIEVTSKEFTNMSESDIMDNALCRFKTQMQALVRTWFSAPMMIISVEKEKKGLPDKVLVNAGSDMFDNGKQNSCPGDVSITDLFHSKKIVLEVYTEEDINAGGRTYKRVKVIGQLKVESVEGELAVCDVSSGAEDIKALLDNKQTALVRIPGTN